MIPMESPLGQTPTQGRNTALTVPKDGEQVSEGEVRAAVAEDAAGEFATLLAESADMEEGAERTAQADGDHTTGAKLLTPKGEMPLLGDFEGVETTAEGATLVKSVTPGDTGEELLEMTSAPKETERSTKAPEIVKVPHVSAPPTHSAEVPTLGPPFVGDQLVFAPSEPQSLQNTVRQPTRIPSAPPAAKTDAQNTTKPVQLTPEPQADLPKDAPTATLREAVSAKATELPPPPQTPVPTLQGQPALDLTKADNFEFASRPSVEPQAPRIEAPRPIPASAPEARPVVAQIAAAVVRAEGGKVDIRLDPPELGRLTMTISGGDEAVSAVVAADRADTQDLLRRHADMLHRALRDAGYSDVTLDFSPPPGGGGADKDAENAAPNSSVVQDDVANTTTYNYHSASSGLDLRL